MFLWYVLDHPVGKAVGIVEADAVDLNVGTNMLDARVDVCTAVLVSHEPLHNGNAATVH